MLSASRVGSLLSEKSQRWSVGASSFEHPDMTDAALAVRGMRAGAWAAFRWAYVHAGPEAWRTEDARRLALILGRRAAREAQGRKLDDERLMRMIILAMRELRGELARIPGAKGNGNSARARAIGVSPGNWRRYSDLYESIYQCGLGHLAQAKATIRDNQTIDA